MEPENIRLELFKRRKKTSMSKIAKDLGVSHQAVSAVVAGELISERIMIAVADAIGHDPKYVWPDRFLKKAS